MSNIVDEKTELSSHDEERRRFLLKARNMAVTAPAAALLLSASTKQVMAQSTYNNGYFGTSSPGNSGPNNKSPFP